VATKSCRGFFVLLLLLWWLLLCVCVRSAQKQQNKKFIVAEVMSEWISPQSARQEVDREVKCDLCSFNADIYRLLEGYLAREEFQAFL
jgi:hypothetical protein